MYRKVMNFAVLGAGNGGQAMAAFLALKGYKVNLYNRSLERINALHKLGGIYLSGVFEGFAKLNKITTNAREALENAEVIMVVTPAVAHKYIAREISPYLKDGQVILLNPGRTGGALEFNNTLDNNGCSADVIVSEAQTFIYASRVIGPGKAKILGVKNKVAIAALPSIKTREVIDLLHPIFPQFSPVENVLKTSLDNIGAIFHPTPTLFNLAWIESRGGDFTYYQEGISPSVAKILEKLDKERMNVAIALGIDPSSAQDWLRMVYGVKGRNLYELLQNNNSYYGLNAPDSIYHRYIFEDVPMSLVPIASLGRMLGVKTPVINMIISIANIVHETDYWQSGRTVESLGLSGLTTSQIKKFVNTGVRDDTIIMSRIKRKLNRNENNYVFSRFKDKFADEGGID
jgi:opine dehydrogenase